LFFASFPKRQCHLREPHPGEQDEHFMTLGFHPVDRRRILAWKVPRGSAFGAGRILRIPFLQFSDETISDDDRVLLPLLHQIMMGAAEEYGMQAPTTLH
jgi:hypothetical protein